MVVKIGIIKDLEQLVQESAKTLKALKQVEIVKIST